VVKCFRVCFDSAPDGSNFLVRLDEPKRFDESRNSFERHAERQLRLEMVEIVDGEVAATEA